MIGTPPADLEERAPIVARPGDALEVDEADVVCEDGEVRHIDGELPDDFPLGYHWLQSAEGRRRRLIVSPGRCWLPDDRAWGWAVQLYATRSRASWGIGDLADLRAVRRMAADQGAGFVLINPLHAVAPTRRPGGQPLPAGHPPLPQPDLPAGRRGARRRRRSTSRTTPAGRCRDGAADRPRRDLGPQARGADAHLLRPRRRRGVRPLAGGAGADRCRTGRPGPRSPRSTAATGTPGPRSCAVPQGPELAGYVEQHGAVVAFHAWLQWALDLQFTAATGDMTVIQDLPIGVAGGGADAWTWQDVLAEGVSVGAPAGRVQLARARTGARRR